MHRLLRLLPLLGLCSCLQWRHSDEDLADIYARRHLPLSIHYVEHHGLPVRYVEVRAQGREGAGRPNVLFIHGAPSSLRVWMSYLTDTALIRVANLYALDRPGFGHSSFGHPDTSLISQVEACEAILARHPGPWVVFGSSYGGPIAAVLAARQPERVRSLLLTSPALAPGQEKIYPISYYIRRPAFGWFYPAIVRVANAEKLSHYGQLMQAEPYYDRVSQPVTYIHGGQDELIYPINATYAAERFAGTQIKFLRLEDRPHFFTFSEQGLITRELVGLFPPAASADQIDLRVEAADSARLGRRNPNRPMPLPKGK